MKRLTERFDVKIYYPYCKNKKGCGYCAGCDFNTEINNKLTDYEDAEEQGLLLKLPCKIGDIVYLITSDCNNVHHCHAPHCNTCQAREDFIIQEKFNIELLDKMNKSVFLTKEDAERKLNEMKGIKKMGNVITAEMPLYVSRIIDLLLDVSGYPRTKHNRDVLYDEIVKRLNTNDIENMNTLALEGYVSNAKNEFEKIQYEALKICEDNKLLNPYGFMEPVRLLPRSCYDIDFFADINSKWPECE